MKLKGILTFLGMAAVLVGWGMTWANQSAKINVNRSDIETIDEKMDNVTGQVSESEKAIVRMETKIEYIVKGIDEIKAELKGKR
jgi:peptidoglycan hydrolase CwlO-like protein